MLIDNPDVSVDELMTAVKGPDFPTGATILGREGIRQAYATGRGIIKVRAKAEIEPMAKNKNRIVVTEIPYQVNKARLLENIAYTNIRSCRILSVSSCWRWWITSRRFLI